MDHLDHLRGSYREELTKLEQQRAELIAQARALKPANAIELVAASEFREAEHRLNWVNVPDPRSDDLTPTMEILPVLILWDDENEKNSGPEIVNITLYGKLPGGKARFIGEITAFKDSKPSLALNVSTSEESAEALLEQTAWDTADAELFLALAKSAFDAQGS